MDIKCNDVIGAFVNTANDEPVTQAELLAWAAENPLPCLLYTSPSPRDGLLSRMPSSA